MKRKIAYILIAAAVLAGFTFLGLKIKSFRQQAAQKNLDTSAELKKPGQPDLSAMDTQKEPREIVVNLSIASGTIEKIEGNRISLKDAAVPFVMLAQNTNVYTVKNGNIVDMNKEDLKEGLKIVAQYISDNPNNNVTALRIE